MCLITLFPNFRKSCLTDFSFLEAFATSLVDLNIVERRRGVSFVEMSLVSFVIDFLELDRCSWGDCGGFSSFFWAKTTRISANTFASIALLIRTGSAE